MCKDCPNCKARRHNFDKNEIKIGWFNCLICKVWVKLAK